MLSIMFKSENDTPLAHLCQQFGFDARAQERRLALMGLTDEDAPILSNILSLAIQPQVHTILTQFYDYLLGFRELQPFLGGPDQIQRLKTTQREYLLSFGVQFKEMIYFEYRLRIGIAHERVGLPLYMYLSAYRYLQSLILGALPPAIRHNQEEFSRYYDSANKIMMLDISLVIDAYTRVQTDLTSASLQALTNERDQLTNQLMHDSLTGSLSRRFILEALNKQLAQLSRQPSRQLGLALLDLDRFKLVNDTYGHLIGDKVLSEFCRVVGQRVREQDYFGRFGGEEFLVILPDIPEKEALTVLERMRTATQSYSFNQGGRPIALTLSMGFTMARPNEKIDDVIDRADAALYQAKSSGRNQIVTA